ncbi:glycosyltransferase family 2 protein [Cellvibrio japonicus]|uniref:Beta-1, 4-galactosyltransferase, putative, gt2a n=1 Tax=Cellvibrio japonicus (strain Ueda107) TaxID=498211 RepID=B3PI38_CELJU|nr:glycosyltransferase family 2 protein [Cellvibrio japonicus]ACE83759.1 beta-1, 4-galactosyltransferase, putative, gt2a [Cellvibrio japonicus Ueda107]QEI11089.1 glycosyltransferase family 2 protein [Cellvibrio japonicus]QEI14663.1 glycosyltransferase family 2 protein [Cellvibrio japonicus]QEI18243.1 glycosyltransferase family 2 protein [Cellvibrio japonicus]
MTYGDPCLSTCQPAISVIVPVYNVDTYVANCIRSLLMQENAPTYEIILVNDGSTDNSKAICEVLQQTTPAIIRLFNHEFNQGLSIARNTGLAQVRGEYFTFVDADDLIPPSALGDLYAAACEYNADIVKGNNWIFSKEQRYPANYNTKRTRIFHSDKILIAFYEHQLMRGHTWGKLFRTSVFVDIPNQPGVAMAQDTLYCAEMFAKANTLVVIPRPVYEYRLRAGSATGRKYETKAYLWWLYSIEQAGRFARTPKQKRRHKQLQMRTLIQISKEARQLNNLALGPVVNEVHQHQARWNLLNLWQVARHGLGVRWILHFIQFAFILARLERRLEKPVRFSNAS